MDLYFSWLVSKVCHGTGRESYEHNKLILDILSQRVFTSPVFLDKNRVYDGLELRTRFLNETDRRTYAFGSSDASILEVLIALAIRCEESLMGDNKKDNTRKWFWLMIDNLDIRGCTDEFYIDHVLNVFINRTYNYDGTGGGLFHVNEPRNDMRKTEIWYQMCWYLNQTQF